MKKIPDVTIEKLQIDKSKNYEKARQQSIYLKKRILELDYVYYIDNSEDDFIYDEDTNQIYVIDLERWDANVEEIEKLL